MKARITVITVCVDDLERSLAFYRDGLGLKTKGISESNSSMAQLPSLTCRRGSSSRSGRVPALPMIPASLQANQAPRNSPSGITFPPKLKLTRSMAQAKRAGATIENPPRTLFGEAMPGTFKIPISICGRWYGTRSGFCQNEACAPASSYRPAGRRGCRPGFTGAVTSSSLVLGLGMPCSNSGPAASNATSRCHRTQSRRASALMNARSAQHASMAFWPTFVRIVAVALFPGQSGRRRTGKAATFLARTRRAPP